MKTISIDFTRVRDVALPDRGTPHSAGIDFYVPYDFEPTTVQPGDMIKIPSGIHASFNTGFALIAHHKSGVATKKHLEFTAGVVDADYQGEIIIAMRNVGKEPVSISPGDKIVQFVLMPVVLAPIKEVESLELLYTDETERGTGGFGHTGTTATKE